MIFPDWLNTFLILLVFAMFGGILDVLQIIDIPKILAGKEVVASRERMVQALVLGALGGAGGALAVALYLGLQEELLQKKPIFFIGLGTVSGFLGYRILRTISKQVDKQLEKLQLMAVEQAKKIEETEDALKEQGEEIKETASTFILASAEGIGKRPGSLASRAPGAGTLSYQGPDPDDPVKGFANGAKETKTRIISATVTPLYGDREWFKVHVVVKSKDPIQHPLMGVVKFYLHPTFVNPEPVVEVTDGIAVLKRIAYGAFTVGAEADEGQTKLELDLHELAGAPDVFRSR